MSLLGAPQETAKLTNLRDDRYVLLRLTLSGTDTYIPCKLGRVTVYSRRQAAHQDQCQVRSQTHCRGYIWDSRLWEDLLVRSVKA